MKFATQTAVSSQVVDDIVWTIAEANNKAITKVGTVKLKEIYNTYVQKFFMIFVHDFVLQKLIFPYMIACFIHHHSFL